MSGQKRAQVIRTIRLDDDQIEALLRRLDEAEPPSGSQGTDKSYPYRLKSCTVYVQQPGDGVSAAYSVPTRSLSSRSLTFIHGGFIHPHSGCVMQLISQHGTWENVAGHVMSCNHVDGAIHEILVSFREPIDIGIYCPESVKVRVLFVEDEEALAKLGTLYLERLNAEVEYACNGQVAMDIAKDKMFDLIITDIEMPEMDGLTATRKLRELGYTGKIAAATGRTRPEDRQACLEAGCDMYVPKPYKIDDFRNLFEALREEPLFSSLAEDSSMEEFINNFVKELPGKLRSIEEAMNQNDLEQLERATRQLKAEAGGFGFEPISDAAAAVETAVQDSKGDEAITTNMSQLVHWCQLARGIESKQ
ncbi:MAG: Hpt domain-containing response regulator [Phycisphaerae bacterium]